MAALLAALIRLINLWLNGRLAAAVGSDLSCEAYRRTLYQPYSVHLQRHSSSVITGATSQINLTVSARAAAADNFCCGSSLWLIGLLLIDAPVALVAGGIFGIATDCLLFCARVASQQKVTEAAASCSKRCKRGWEPFEMCFLMAANPYLKIYRQADRPQRHFRRKTFS